MAHRITALIFAFVVTEAAQAEDTLPTLSFIDSRPLYHPAKGLTEPSGLAVQDDGRLIVVDDESSAMFVIDWDGRVVESVDIAPPIQDLEGIVFDEGRNRVLLLSEQTRSLYDVDPETGKTKAAHPIVGMSGGAEVRFREDGPEGLSIGQDGSVLVVIEYPPRLLWISPDLGTIFGISHLDPEIGFQSPRARRTDASGLAYDASRDAIWILSDTGRAVFSHPLDGATFARFDLRFTDDEGDMAEVSNPEGIAISRNGTNLFVATDDGKSSRLMRYEIE